jgi:hypothetical protein
MTSFREDFGIEIFEAGRGQWHARIRRAKHKPLIINGVAVPLLEVGFARPDGTTAIGDAKTHIDRFEPRASHSDTSGIQLPPNA